MTRVDVQGVGLEVLHLLPAHPRAALAPLLLLHEGLGSVAMWRDWPRQVCEGSGRSTWLFSRRGYGRSDPIADVRGPTRVAAGVPVGRLEPDYMHDQAWQVLPALLQALGLQRPVLLGHSDGASIALLHASRFPVTGCIVLAPHVIVEDMSIAAINQARQAYLDGDLRQRLARYHADVDCAFWQWNDIWLDPAFRSFDIRDECRSISAPVLAIQGLDDPYGSAAQIEQIEPATAPIQRQLLAHCGHSPQRDQPDNTTTLITNFLEGLS